MKVSPAAAAAARAKGNGGSDSGGDAAGQMKEHMDKVWELLKSNFDETFPIFGAATKTILSRVSEMGAGNQQPAEASATPQEAPAPPEGMPAQAPPTPGRQAA